MIKPLPPIWHSAFEDIMTTLDEATDLLPESDGFTLALCAVQSILVVSLEPFTAESRERILAKLSKEVLEDITEVDNAP